MRHVSDPIGIQIVTVVVAPEIAAAVMLPPRRGALSNQEERTQILYEVVFSEGIFVRTAEHLEGNIILGNHVAAEEAFVERLQEDTYLVVNNEISFGKTLATLLKQDSEGTESTIMKEGIATKCDVAGVHNRSPGHVFGEKVILETIVIRKHVMHTVAQAGYTISPDHVVWAALDVQAVAGFGDDVPFKKIPR